MANELHTSAFDSAARVGVDDGVAVPVAPRGGLAVFDLDRTLLPGSSLVALGRALVAAGLVERRLVARHALSALAYRRRGEREGQASDLQSRLLAVAAGREHAPLAARASQVGTELVEEVTPTARWLVRRHVERGDFVVVVSASVHELVEAIAAGLGAHRGIGTRVSVVDGRLDGRLRGPFCHGEGKLARLRAELGEIDLTGATAYSDSASDLPLLTAAGSAVAVNPDRRLAARARSEGWPVVRFD